MIGALWLALPISFVNSHAVLMENQTGAIHRLRDTWELHLLDARNFYLPHFNIRVVIKINLLQRTIIFNISNNNIGYNLEKLKMLLLFDIFLFVTTVSALELTKSHIRKQVSSSQSGEKVRKLFIGPSGKCSQSPLVLVCLTCWVKLLLIWIDYSWKKDHWQEWIRFGCRLWFGYQC